MLFYFTVLKAIETIGISHTKGNPKYCELLEKEIMATKLKDSFLRIRNNLTKVSMVLV